MANKTKSGLPLGVTERKNRPGLYQMRVMVNGKRYSEDYRSTETSKKKLQSELQKAFDTFKERVESGLLKSGDISEKSTFTQAVEWFTNMRKLEIRESTQLADVVLAHGVRDFSHVNLPPYILGILTNGDMPKSRL